MGYLNSVTLIGRLGNDLTLKKTKNDHSVCELRVCTQWKEETEWTSCVAWRRDAEIACAFLNKGDQVCVEGRLHTRKWMGDDGVEHYRTEVVVNRLVLIGEKKKTHQTARYNQPFSSPQPSSNESIDAIPF